MEAFELGEEINRDLQRQRGYFDTKYLNDAEIARLGNYGRVIPGFDIMKTLTTVCELRLRLRRERRAAKRQTKALQLIVAIAPTRRVTAAAQIARAAIAGE